MSERVSATEAARGAQQRALDQLDLAEGDIDGPPDRVDLVVVYSVGREIDDAGGWHESGGWACTAGPKWLHAAMLRRAADAHDEAYESRDRYSEEDADDEDGQ